MKVKEREEAIKKTAGNLTTKSSGKSQATNVQRAQNDMEIADEIIEEELCIDNNTQSLI